MCVCRCQFELKDIQKDTINLSLTFYYTYSRQVYVGRVCVISVLTDEARYLSIWERGDTHTHTLWHRHSSRTLDGVWIHSPVYAYLWIFLEASCFNMKDNFVWCKIIGFWSLLWIIWFREKFLELNSNTINWLPAFKNIFYSGAIEKDFPSMFSILFCKTIN